MISDCLRTWGALAIAAIALVQPWIIALWKKFLQPGRVELFPTGEIEVGFSLLGPTIGLHGVLCAKYQDLFVRKIELLVVRHKDGAKHSFDWSLFCGYQGTFSTPQDVTVELASGFLLRIQDPNRYRIVFSDVNTRGDINSLLYPFRAAWDTKRTEIFSELAQVHPQDPFNPQNLPILLQGAYQQFNTSDEHVRAFSEIGKVFYWEPGEYSLELIVHTTTPVKPFNWKWSFSLTREDSEGLRLNVLSLLETVCIGQSNYQHFAYPKYR